MTATTLPRGVSTARRGPARDRVARLLRGREADPVWVRPALLGPVALTSLLYLVDLSKNGWANDFYAAAVQAGTKSWKAFFFGSFDSSNFITVDKTPGSLWVMELSARVFGVNYWSLLVPQALEGVASVAILYAAVRRWSGPAAGLLAGLVLALTPVAVLMFRFNNPDALLVLLMTAAAYAMVRAIERGATKWLIAAGALLGFAFLAKMLQAFLVVPGFALAYLWAGPPKLGKRLWQLLLAGLAIVVSAGWWVLAATLTPAADRPYFGGSTNNNVLQLAIGYNGLGRLTGDETGSIGFNASSAGGPVASAASAGGKAAKAGASGTGASGTGASGTGVSGTGASGTGVSGTGSSGTGASGTGSSGTAGSHAGTAGQALSGAGHALTGSAGHGLAAGGGGAPSGSAFGGATGLSRLFSSEFGGQASWLLPAALLSLLVLLWVSRRAVRTDRTRAAAMLWGGWLLCTGLVFSYMSGIIHTYYTVALVPAIGALTGIGAAALWRSRHGWPARVAAAVILTVSAAWAYELLSRTPAWLPWLRWVVLLSGLTSAGAILAWPYLAGLASTHRGRLALAGIPLTLGLVAGMAGQAAYALDTVSSTHTGSLPTAGPQDASFGGAPGGGGTGGRGGPGGFAGASGTGTRGGTGTHGGTGTPSGAGAPGGTGFPSGTGAPGGTGVPGGTGTRGGTGVSGAAPGSASTGSARTGTAGGTGGSPGGGAGGLGGSTQVSSALTRLLERGASGYKWVAATEGSQEAAPLELATGDAVMAIGGFNGTDPAPTLAEFKAMVAKHEIHYYIGRSSESFGGGTGSSAIASWVAAHFTHETVGGNTVYNLTQPKTAS